MKYVSVVPPCYIPPRSGPIFPISSCSLPYGVEEPCGSNSFVVWTSSIFIFIPVFVMFASWDERIALVNSALCHAYIYACAPEPSMDAHGKDAQHHEGLAYSEAITFKPSATGTWETVYISVPKLNENEILVCWR